MKKIGYVVTGNRGHRVSKLLQQGIPGASLGVNFVKIDVNRYEVVFYVGDIGGFLPDARVASNWGMPLLVFPTSPGGIKKEHVPTDLSMPVVIIDHLESHESLEDAHIASCLGQLVTVMSVRTLNFGPGPGMVRNATEVLSWQ